MVVPFCDWCWGCFKGINRLGKAPPKPGTLRPPDPNKYRTVDMFSEGTEGDADYMRMVQDVSSSGMNCHSHTNGEPSTSDCYLLVRSLLQ